MTDPIETAQQAQHAAEAGAAIGAGGMLGAVGLIGALAKLWQAIFGTRAERAAAKAQEADAAARLVDVATDIAESSREETVRTRAQRDTCEERLAAMESRLRAVEAIATEHATCGPRIAHLEREARISRQMLADLMRSGSTPPSGLYVPDDVRAALAAQEDTGP